jgi:hypothetical protein
MGYIDNLRARGLSAVAVMAMGLVLASCATAPATGSAGPQAPQGMPTGSDSTTLNGRLMITVVDQEGTLLGRAAVQLRGLGKVAHRQIGATNADGRVEFKGVPEQVEVFVEVPNGSYTDSVSVPQDGAPADIRITIETTDAREEDITGA